MRLTALVTLVLAVSVLHSAVVAAHVIVRPPCANCILPKPQLHVTPPAAGSVPTHPPPHVPHFYGGHPNTQSLPPFPRQPGFLSPDVSQRVDLSTCAALQPTLSHACPSGYVIHVLHADVYDDDVACPVPPRVNTFSENVCPPASLPASNYVLHHDHHHWPGMHAVSERVRRVCEGRPSCLVSAWNLAQITPCGNRHAVVSASLLCVSPDFFKYHSSVHEHENAHAHSDIGHNQHGYGGHHHHDLHDRDGHASFGGRRGLFSYHGDHHHSHDAADPYHHHQHHQHPHSPFYSQDPHYRRYLEYVTNHPTAHAHIHWSSQ